MTPADILCIVVLAVLILLALGSIRRQLKGGHCAGCSGCSGCGRRKGRSCK